MENFATELYVQRKEADLIKERDGLKADLEVERKLNREMAANKEANKETLRILNKIDNDMALRNSAAKQPAIAGKIGCFPPMGKVHNKKKKKELIFFSFALTPTYVQ